MDKSSIAVAWVYLSASPLSGLTVTLVAYGIAYRLYSYAKFNPLLNPVLTAVILLITVLLLSGISYKDYFEGGQFIHFLLGPATVALAIPLYHQITKLKKIWLPITISLLAGVVIGALSSISIAWLLDASVLTQLSFAPKSVTAPIAMGISESIGGLPALTAILVVSTGIIGATIGTKLFELLRIDDDSIKGVAMGVTAHGIGTARAFQVSSEMGAFSGLAMALSAFSTAVILPWLLAFMGFIP
ncbi:TIGR00659 family protein [Nitrosomonas cryotolerans]|uniref:TIGR00659 family protein n=1 Tax=Nitrosomonas cryotolerans ATCC 49181 TaxID=1131553 RepID=A0A1N6GN00_9PROT|nr:LrgB family protein [Nitrosomonas cryotolerans]SFP98011.1 TIGR00659 family protein [Nitrosomonas cryotolerans]SIO08842.1 TIGR00659 family protein [Nitrosomonas cryotolerans ATCC 49181]